ncbi:MAG TPA: CDP-alcohol phosphatidyltransferase family protein [Polyangiaceae bacterium]|nr:CDP-alcohol phosphatidyltransferase family protein [Polyangiaceae bacterium]
MTLPVRHALLLLLATAVAVATGRPFFPALLGVSSLLASVVALRRSDPHFQPLSAANGVTLARVAASLAVLAPGLSSSQAALLVLVCLGLDAVDGPLARRFGTTSPLSAAFDMEADALLVLFSALRLFPVSTGLVLVAGLLRPLYAVLLALFPGARGEAPRSTFGRFVFAIVVLSHVASLAGGPALSRFLLPLSTLLLCHSFGRSAWWSFFGPRAFTTGVDGGIAPNQTRASRPPLESPR